MENWGLFTTRRIRFLGWFSKIVYDFRSHIKQDPINDLLVKGIRLIFKKMKGGKKELQERWKRKNEEGKKARGRGKKAGGKEIRREGSKQGGRKREGRKEGNELLCFFFFFTDLWKKRIDDR